LSHVALLESTALPEASPATGEASGHDDAEWEAFQAHQRDAARLPYAEEARVLFATAGCAAQPCLLWLLRGTRVHGNWHCQLWD